MDVEQHKHCMVCGKAIPLKQQYCSMKCKTKHQVAIKKQKRWMNVLWIIMIFLVLIMVLNPSG